MLRVELALRGYQVGSRLEGFRPFGHLFIEYASTGENTRIFRACPRFVSSGLMIYAENTPVCLSRDRPSRIIRKRPVVLLRREIGISYTFNGFIKEMNELSYEINLTRTFYGLFVNNSNTVADLAWRFITKQELRFSDGYNGYFYTGRTSKGLERRIRVKDRFKQTQLLV